MRLGPRTPWRPFLAYSHLKECFFEMDMLAHCEKSVAGSHVHSLVLTDIASGRKEAVAMELREQASITTWAEEVRLRLRS